MKLDWKRRAAIVLCVILLLFTGPTFAGRSNPDKVNHNIEHLKEMINYIKDYYVGEVSEELLWEGAYKGLFRSLDPYSGYLNPHELTSLTMDTSDGFGGVGIQVSLEDGRITVRGLIVGGPADRAGMKPGDVIVAVDGVDVRKHTFEGAINLILGEPGTKVQLGIMRDGKPDILYIDIMRERISNKPVVHKVVSGNIGYILISQFNEKAGEQVEKALGDFTKKNVKGIILDLRNNPGGLLDEAVNVAELFVPKGPIVYIEYKNKELQSFSSITNKYPKPLVVLVNGESASASEIVAGAIQDTKSGIVLGTKTYGKGTVQSIIPVDNGGAVKLTIAKYMTAKKRNLHGAGITPDITVVNPIDIYKNKSRDFVPMLEEEDSTLHSKGLNVYGAQQRLVYLGYEDLKITGIMDSNTAAAIQSFQKSNELNPSGILNAATRDKLEEKVLETISGIGEDLQLKKAMEVILQEDGQKIK